MKKIKLKIEGMHCESCAKVIAMELEDKISKVDIDYKHGTAEIEFDEKKTNEKEIAQLIVNAGYKLKK